MVMVMTESHDTQNNGNSLVTSLEVLKILQLTLMFEESSFPGKTILTTKYRGKMINYLEDALCTILPTVIIVKISKRAADTNSLLATLTSLLLSFQIFEKVY